MSDARIGGGVSSRNYALLFVFGAIVGTVLRTGVWLSPDAVVEFVKRRL